MLVSKDKLTAYDIADDCYFARRTGSGTPTSRDQFYINNPARLMPSTYCAIGDDTEGWQLEQYNGVNWVEIDADSSYSLIITNNGLAALTNTLRGGYKLQISGIKILDSLVTSPSTPIINWTDTEFLQAGKVNFSVGTNNSPNDSSQLTKILSWKFLDASGGLQYIVTLPPEGVGSETDDGEEEWVIGAIGLYVKSPDDGVTDVLFAVGCLPGLVEKYGTTVERIGNSVKFYLNTVLNNLGIVSNLEVMQEDNHSIPEVANESLLTYPDDPLKRPYNCYVVDSLYGTGIPALAVPRVLTSESQYDPDWAYFEPSDNYLQVPETKFSGVDNYIFVYWDATNEVYKPAEGRVVGNTAAENEKLPMGIRISNTIVFAGTIVNQLTSYTYNMSLAAGGADYEVGDELLVPTANNIKFKVRVTGVNTTGAITSFETINQLVGNVQLDPATQTIALQKDPRSSLAVGNGAKVTISGTAQTNNVWNFPSSWLNKPLYCDQGANAGKPTLTKTDAFLGWCIGTNSIKLALDLRNEASTTVYGTTRYATNSEVKEVVTSVNASTQTAITPATLKANYLQTSIPTNTSQTGSTLANPINVESYVRFDKIVLGKGSRSPYNNTGVNPYVTDDDISFYGTAFRSWWADLAEFYEADKQYEPGTLMCIGDGEKEMTIATNECNGIISTKPGYQLGERKSDLYLPVALCGRIPVKMDGHCLAKFGDRIYLSKIKPGCASTVINGPCLGKIIQKDFGTSKLVECIVRIEF